MREEEMSRISVFDGHFNDRLILQRRITEHVFRKLQCWVSPPPWEMTSTTHSLTNNKNPSIRSPASLEMISASVLL